MNQSIYQQNQIASFPQPFLCQFCLLYHCWFHCYTTVILIRNFIWNNIHTNFHTIDFIIYWVQFLLLCLLSAEFVDCITVFADPIVVVRTWHHLDCILQFEARGAMHTHTHEAPPLYSVLSWSRHEKLTTVQSTTYLHIIHILVLFATKGTSRQNCWAWTSWDSTESWISSQHHPYLFS